MWILPGPMIEPVFPALGGRFFTIRPPEKSKLLASYKVLKILLDMLVRSYAKHKTIPKHNHKGAIGGEYHNLTILIAQISILKSGNFKNVETTEIKYLMKFNVDCRFVKCFFYMY